MVAYEGERFKIIFATELCGAVPADEFFNQLSKTDKAKLMALFKLAGDHASFKNKEKFGDLGHGLFEFKSFQNRMPFAYAKTERSLIVITHGFVKKKNKTPQQEIDRAWRIFNEDQSLTGKNGK